MILAAILIAATGIGQVSAIPSDGRDQTPRSWIRSIDRTTRQPKWVWGWESNRKVYHYEDEQATAPKREPAVPYPTGVDPRRFGLEDHPKGHASDPEAARIAQQILSQEHSHANGQCPDNQPCPLRPPKKPDEKAKLPEVPVKLDWNLRTEYIIAIVLILAGIIAISGGNRRAD